MRTNLTDDHKIITLWPAESISRGDSSRLPFRRIWQSTRLNFSPLLSTPAFPDTSENIFEGDLRMRTNLTDDHKIITLWPAESISRGDRSRLPFRQIGQAHVRTPSTSRSPLASSAT